MRRRAASSSSAPSPSIDCTASADARGPRRGHGARHRNRALARRRNPVQGAVRSTDGFDEVSIPCFGDVGRTRGVAPPAPSAQVGPPPCEVCPTARRARFRAPIFVWRRGEAEVPLQGGRTGTFASPCASSSSSSLQLFPFLLQLLSLLLPSSYWSALSSLLLI